jgi:parallel beta-helix repeat protein
MVERRPVSLRRAGVAILVMALAAGFGMVPSGRSAAAEDALRRAELRVGIDSGDIRGSDNVALQAAVDQVAALGGGIVHIGPGRYTMRNALRLRDRVQIRGVAGETVLVACDGVESRLACDGDCNERQITLEEPAGFRVGDGVSIQDEQSGGFMVTTATLTAQLDDRTFAISAPLYLDYMVAQRATAQVAFPVVGGWSIRDASVEGLTIEGNRANRGRLDGCRGGGIYLFECRDVAIRDCVVRDYNGDGISFQVSQRVVVEDCTAENNAGLGLHPGSGSQDPIVRRNRSRNNDRDGLFVCWRVKRGLFEDNELHENGGAGISIGHKDTDNLFRANTITGNGGAGVLFREESEPMGAHRNVFERNRIVDNGRSDQSRAAGVLIHGHHHDLVFRDNTIGSTSSGDPAGAGIVASPHSDGLKAEGNRFLNTTAEIEKGR